MKKKPVPKGDESDASDAVDEPEEVSEDDAAKRRSSGRLRGAKKPRLAEPDSSEGEDEENEDDEEEPDEEDDDEENEDDESGGDSEEEYKTDQVKRKKRRNGSTKRGRPPKRRDVESEDDCEVDETGVAKEFTSGAYVVLKTDFANGGNPPIWKIDGKALLQKYIPFEQDGKTLYKNTSTYSGWSTGNKDNYHSAPIVYKTQNRKETIVEFLRDSIKVDAAAPAAAAEDDDPSATEQ